MLSVSSYYFNELLHYVSKTTALSVEKLQQQYPLTPGGDNFEINRVSFEQHQSLMQLGATISGNKLFGLEFGQQASTRSFSLLAYLTLSSSTLLQAANLLQKYEALVSTIGQAKVFEREDNYSICWHPDTSINHLSYHVIDAILAGWINFARYIVQHDMNPIKVSLSHHGNHAEIYQSIWNCPVEMHASKCELLISKADMDRPVVLQDKVTNQALQISANRKLREIKTSHEYYDKVYQCIYEHYLTTNIELKVIAAKLDVNPRQLQHCLKMEGYSFNFIWDSIRKELAITLINGASDDLVAIAHQLQFSEQSAFNRAFKRWTGRTPREYQANPGQLHLT
ncbi:AraC family transcriptional regulator [Pleionea sp. CnH1-48]|uniref:AraC family transcriptional regulator n=1 Tax=Pleionea sp. CnH1-48 TaxID=2954494 RepID=UPI00209754BC|nr:AraC family transcriptional regulator [Pleionea sp. CnH1-48]MCO7225241.1 AraC family transcriptional regulator [Pleionea sp. CnH1-48]